MKRFVLLLLAALPLRGATFLVPTDHDLVLGAKAVVVALAGTSHGSWVAGGWIETVTAMHAVDVIRGPIIQDETFEVNELGGRVGTIGYAVPGAPRYVAGERLLLFLEWNDRGGWTAKNMVVGKFAFTTDALGRELLLRDARNLCGWDYSGVAHVEPQRLAQPFLEYVRGVARGEAPAIDYIVHDPLRLETESVASAATPTISSYLIQDTSKGRGIRWNSFPAAVTFSSFGTQPGAMAGGLTAAQRGLAAWTNDAASNVVYLYGGVLSTALGGLTSFDGVNSILFNDPNNEIPGAYTGTSGDTLAVGGAWFGGGSHTFGGEQFTTIVQADLVVQNGISGAGLTGNGFDHVLTHELGHTLGFRHSDDPPSGGTSTTNAIMNSSVFFNGDSIGSSLQAWDKEALAAVYGSGVTVGCTPPQITAQPQSLALQGDNAVLSVTATGSLPLQYQWYVGAKGSTVQTVDGGTGPQIAVKPAVTTSYWVRIANGCSPSADSDAAVVTVNGCSIVLISGLSPATTLIQGLSTTLSVTASGGNGSLTYQWFRGNAGDTAAPVAGATAASLTVSPASTTKYWVRVSSSCGAVAISDAVEVTVQPCQAAQIVVRSQSGQFVAGDLITLSATVIGTTPISLQWAQNGATLPNATAATVSVGPLFSPASFTVRAQNLCGDTSSPLINYTRVPSCVVPAITQQPGDRLIDPGATAIVEISATGTSLTYRWYEGDLFDFTHPVGASTPQLYTGAVTAVKKYWVRITNSCGSVDSAVATVTPGVSRRRSAVH